VSFLNETSSKAPVNVVCQHMITRYILLCGQTCDHCIRDFWSYKVGQFALDTLQRQM